MLVRAQADARYGSAAILAGGGVATIYSNTYGVWISPASGDGLGYPLADAYLVAAVPAHTTISFFTNNGVTEENNTREEHFVIKAGPTGNAYFLDAYFDAGGDQTVIAAGDGTAKWIGATPFAYISNTVTLADGDVITDSATNGTNGFYGIAAGSQTNVGVITFRWITGAHVFAANAPIFQNGTNTGAIFTNAAAIGTMGNSNSVITFDGSPTTPGTNSISVWNNSASTRNVQIRISK